MQAEEIDIEFDKTPMDGDQVDEPKVDEAEVDEPEAKAEPEADEPEKAESDDDDDERVEFDAKTQARVDKIVQERLARNARTLQEEQQKRQELEQSLQKYQQKQQEVPGRPEIPPVPDPFEDNFEQKVQERDQALAKAAQYDAYMSFAQQQHQYEQQKAQEAQQAQLRSTLDTYNAAAKKLGVKPQELDIAGKQVAAIGMDAGLAEFILNDTAGPRLTVYLAENLAELEKINAMGPIRGAAYLESIVKPKVSSRRSSAPPPIESGRGAGVPAGKGGPPDVTYE